MRRGPGSLYRRFLTLGYVATRDRAAIRRFLGVPGERRLRLRVLSRFLAITNHVRGYHTLGEMLRLADAVLVRGRERAPLVVECGVAFGSGTAKLGVAAAAVGGRVLAFDSFRGIPPNDERTCHLDGRPAVFRPGAFRGREAQVRAVLERWSEPVVELRRGWFEETLDQLGALRIDVAFVDVDLVASSRCCVRAIYPRLSPGGVLFSHDGHLRSTVELFSDPAFWREEVGAAPPPVAGLGRERLLEIPASPAFAPSLLAAR